ncbi:MAG TPA: FG-GAP-like repeat-containing protein [bacterium]|nr:FG-GAP-like repeat-containing protein [bacterium]
MNHKKLLLGVLLIMVWRGTAVGQITDVATGFWQLANDQPFTVSNSALAPLGDIYVLAKGLYSSQDNGFTWQRLPTPADALLDHAPLAVNSRGDVFIAGYHSGPVLYRSRDHGRSWQTIMLTGSCSIDRIFIDPADRLFVLTASGCLPRCFRSDDEGMHWSALRDDLSCFAFVNGKTYAGTNKGFFLASADHGDSWADSTFFCPEVLTDLVVNSAGIIYAIVSCGGDSEKPYGLLARSKDGGITWKIFTDYQGVRQIANGQHDDLYIRTGSGIYRSSDEGEHSTWINDNWDSDCYFILDREQNLLLQFRSDLFRSSDRGESWMRIQANFDRGPHEILIDTSGVVCVGMEGIFARQTEDRHPWSIFTIDSAAANLRVSGLSRHPAGNFYVSTVRHGVYRSADAGEHWQRLTNGSGDSTFSRLTIGKNGRIYTAGTSGQEIYLYFSDDDGQTWHKKTVGSTTPTDQIVALLTPGEDDDDVLLATSSGSLFRSLNGGGSWYEEQIDFALYTKTVIHDRRADCFFLLTSSGLYRRGRMEFIAPWQKLTNGLPDAVSGQAGTLITFPGGLLLALQSGSDNFVDFYYSFDLGEHWTQMDPDAGFQDSEESVAAMALHPDGHLYISAATEIFSYNLLRSRDPIVFPNRFAADPLTNQINAYGVACADCDQDNNDDLLLVNQGQNWLCRNQGNGTFASETAGPVVSASDPSRGATWGDYDNDGLVDLFVANENAANSLFHNIGGGLFNRAADQPLTTEVFPSRAAAWADYNQDGYLDLFVATLNGGNLLYRNDGKGTFTRISSGAPASDGGLSYGCAWADYDLDGDADLFVANYGNNFLYRNDSSLFTKVISGPVVTDGGHSFGGSWGDYDNDGWPDLFVTNTEGVNFLYHNEGHGTFTRIPEGPVVTDTGISKGSAWGDINNDGWLDLYVARNGADALYLNTGGRGFVRLNVPAFALADNSLACAWTDANRDGFLDLVVANYGAPANLSINAGNTAHWLEIRCIGSRSNRSAIGARVQVKAGIQGNVFWQTREITSQSGHSGQNSLIAHYGLGDAAMVDSLRIIWPSGQVQVMTSLRADEFMTIIEPAVTPVELAAFTTAVEEKRVTLCWQTLSEENTYGFEIERRAGDHPWGKIGFVAGHGTTANPHVYDFVDDTLEDAGQYAYRLKIVDQDGRFAYSAAIEVRFGLPDQFALYQNYPNPFNPVTTIEFALPSAEKVRVRIFSLLGEELTELAHGPLPAGYHTIRWNAAGLANGVYFLVLEAGPFRQVRKSVLMK